MNSDYLSEKENCRYLGLVSAVMQQVIQDLKGLSADFPTKKKYRDVAREEEKNLAIEFIFSNENAPFSYVWMCTILGADPEYLRKAIIEDTLDQLELVINPERLDGIPKYNYILKRA